MRAREDRRAAALTEQLDVDGWQVAVAQSMFGDDARAPPLWATEEHVLHLINRAIAANVRVAEEEGRVCVGEARGMRDPPPTLSLLRRHVTCVLLAAARRSTGCACV